MTATHPAATLVHRRPSVSRSVATPLVAAAVAAVPWCLAQVLDVDLVVASNGQVVGLASVLVVSLLAAAAGGLAHRLLRRVTHRRTAWPVLAGTVLLVSLVGPAGAATPAAVLVLTAMHVGVGLTVILGQPRSAAGRR